MLEPARAGETHWTALKFHGYLKTEYREELSYSTLLRYLHENVLEAVSQIPQQNCPLLSRRLVPSSSSGRASRPLKLAMNSRSQAQVETKLQAFAIYDMASRAILGGGRSGKKKMSARRT